MTPADAARAARRQFGNTTRLQEDRRDMQTIPALESFWIDVRQALRAFRKQPTFAAAVVLTLALGIGANTAIFSICNAVLLAPLPYADAGRIVMLWELMGPTPIPVSAANFVDWRRLSRSFESMAAINPFSSFVLTGSGEPVRLSAAAVSWDFFSVLGTRPALGRGFLLEEDQPDRNRVVIVSHALWVERFGQRADILGTSVILNDVSHAVVGVLPPEFELVAKASDFQTRTRFDVWVPLALSATPSRGSHPLRVFARLKPDVALEQAQAEVAAIGAQLAAAYPEENKEKGVGAVPLRQQATADVRRALLTLLAAVGFVLAIACANVANLMLTRSAARQRETALRLAIGASRRRIAQQLLTESTLLGLLGGITGLALASVTMRAVGSYLPADLSRAAGVAIDWRVMLFTALISLATGILFGLAPLLQSRRLSARLALEHGTRVAGRSSSGLRNLLVIGQVAVVLTLLVGAGLMSRSLWSLLQVPLGFRSDQVLTARITLPRARYADVARVSAFQRDLLDRLRNTPGVQSAGAAAYLPLSGDDNGWAIFIEGRPSRGVGVYDFAAYRVVSDGYFETLGMPLLEGRTFTAADTADAPLAIVINQAMARAYWGDQSPLGRRLRFGGTGLRTVVGVVGDVRHAGPARNAQWEMYLPFGQARNVETAHPRGAHRDRRGRHDLDRARGGERHRSVGAARPHPDDGAAGRRLDRRAAIPDVPAGGPVAAGAGDGLDRHLRCDELLRRAAHARDRHLARGWRIERRHSPAGARPGRDPDRCGAWRRTRGLRRVDQADLRPALRRDAAGPPDLRRGLAAAVRGRVPGELHSGAAGDPYRSDDRAQARVRDQDRGANRCFVLMVRIPDTQPRNSPCVFNNLQHRVISLWNSRA